MAPQQGAGHSPDNTGGLKAFGDLALLLFYITILPILHTFAAGMILKWPPPHQLLYLGHVLFAGLVFFLPLLTLRRAMKEAKRLELNRLSAQFTETYKPIMSKHLTPASNGQSLKDRLFDLREVYNETSRMSMWPYDFGILVRFLSGFFIPVIVFIVQTSLSQDSILRSIIQWIRSF